MAGLRVLLRFPIAQERSVALYPYDRYTFGTPSVLNRTNQVVASLETVQTNYTVPCKVARHRTSGYPTQAPQTRAEPS